MRRSSGSGASSDRQLETCICGERTLDDACERHRRTSGRARRCRRRCLAPPTRDAPPDRGGQGGQPGRCAGTGEPARRRQRARRRWGHRARVGGLPREPGRDRSAASSGRDGECRQRSRRDAAVGRRQPRQRGDHRATPGRRGGPEPRAGHRRHAADARRAHWRRGLGKTAHRPRRQRQRQGRRERTDGVDVGDRAAATGGGGGPARRRCRRPRPLEVLTPRRAACAVPRGPAIPRARWSSIRAG